MPAQFGTIKNTYLLINDACKKIKIRIKDYKNSTKKKRSKKDKCFVHKLNKVNQIDDDVCNVRPVLMVPEYADPQSIPFLKSIPRSILSRFWQPATVMVLSRKVK